MRTGNFFQLTGGADFVNKNSQVESRLQTLLVIHCGGAITITTLGQDRAAHVTGTPTCAARAKFRVIEKLEEDRLRHNRGQTNYLPFAPKP